MVKIVTHFDDDASQAGVPATKIRPTVGKGQTLHTTWAKIVEAMKRQDLVSRPSKMPPR